MQIIPLQIYSQSSQLVGVSLLVLQHAPRGIVFGHATSRNWRTNSRPPHVYSFRSCFYSLATFSSRGVVSVVNMLGCIQCLRRAKPRTRAQKRLYKEMIIVQSGNYVREGQFCSLTLVAHKNSHSHKCYHSGSQKVKVQSGPKLLQTTQSTNLSDVDINA